MNSTCVDNFDIKQHFMTHIEDSNMSVLQKEKLSFFGKNIKLIRKDYKIEDGGILYYIVFEIGGETISYKYSFHKNEFYEEIDRKFQMMFLTITSNYPNKYEITLDSKFKPMTKFFSDDIVPAFLGCRLFKEIIDFINKIMQIDNVPKEAYIIFNELEYYRQSLFHISSLYIPPRLQKFIKKEDIDIVIDDSANFKPYESFLSNNVKYHYVLTPGDKYICKFVDNNTKLHIYLNNMNEQDDDDYRIIELNKSEINFASFFTV